MIPLNFLTSKTYKITPKTLLYDFYSLVNEWGTLVPPAGLNRQIFYLGFSKVKKLSIENVNDVHYFKFMREIPSWHAFWRESELHLPHFYNNFIPIHHSLDMWYWSWLNVSWICLTCVTIRRTLANMFVSSPIQFLTVLIAVGDRHTSSALFQILPSFSTFRTYDLI